MKIVPWQISNSLTLFFEQGCFLGDSAQITAGPWSIWHLHQWLRSKSKVIPEMLVSNSLVGKHTLNPVFLSKPGPANRMGLNFAFSCINTRKKVSSTPAGKGVRNSPTQKKLRGGLNLSSSLAKRVKTVFDDTKKEVRVTQLCRAKGKQISVSVLMSFPKCQKM